MKGELSVQLTPFKAAFAAALACLLPLPLVAAPVKTYASAIALDDEELAISAAAGAHPLPPILHRRILFRDRTRNFEVQKKKVCD